MEDSYTKLLIHANDVDTSVMFTDDATGKVVTAVGNAQIDTAQKKFGTGSLLCDGTADYLAVADSADWNFGSGDFTIDFWVRFAAVNAAQAFFIQRADATHRTEFVFYKNGANIDCIGVYSIDGATTIINDFAGLAFAPSINTWYHIALVRYGNIFRAFVDGSKVGSDIAVTGTFPDIAAGLGIGYRLANTDLSFNGWIDEYRISKGIARWTADFTPPTKEYEVGITGSDGVFGTADKCNGGTASADSETSTNYDHVAIDNNPATFWQSANSAFPHWWKYDFGAGVSWKISKLTIQTVNVGTHIGIKNFTLQGSNDDSNWTTVYTGITQDIITTQTFTFVNKSAYRYYKINAIDDWETSYDYTYLNEVQMFEGIYPISGFFMFF